MSALLRRSKHFALLTYLALQNGNLCRRETLLALFWPESDEAHARNALSKTLGRLRTELSDGVVYARGVHDIGLERGSVWVDVEDFSAAVNAGDWARALELYGGDFLAGFHLPAAPAFDSWSDEWRGRLRTDVVNAAQQLADEQERAGDISAAIGSLRRALRIVPTDESVVRHVMTLLHRTGARDAALAAFRALEEVLRVDLETVPEDETRELAVRIHGSAAIRSLAVLPWANLTGSPDQEHISDGLTDIVITELARADVARITSRQSSLQLKGTTIPLADVGRRLCVDAVIEGSVTRYGDRLTVTAQLIRLEPEAHLWAERFEAALGELPVVAERIARAVGKRLRGDRPAAVAPSMPREPSAVNPAALEAYLRGRHFSVMLPQLDKAIMAYGEAIERAPEFAPAWAGLASAYAILTLLAHASPAELFPTFRHAAEQAVRLDPKLGEAHTSLGLYYMLAERDWQRADEALRLGAELGAGAVEPHIHRATYLAALGRAREARAEAARAIDLDPLGPSAYFCSAWCDYKAGKHVESNRKLRELLDLHPHFGIAMPYMALNHALLHESADAEAAAWHGIKLLPNNAEALALGVAALGRSGHGAAAAEPLARLLALGDVQYVDPWAVGVAYVGLGNLDEALRWFRRMYDERSPSAFCIAHDTLLEPLRDEPSFRDLIRRLAFPAALRPA